MPQQRRRGANTSPESAATPDAIAFGEKVVALLEQGAFNATYKYAVLLSLMDVCLEQADEAGTAPRIVHPRTLATRVVELYWPHASVYGAAGADQAIVLRQNRGGQAEIVTLIQRFHAETSGGSHEPLARARARNPLAYRRLVEEVTWKLVEMPLPRLQRFGRDVDAFLYELDWNDEVRRRDYNSGAIDQTLRLRPAVADHLIRLAGLLRPLVQRLWIEHVVALNRAALPRLAEESDLEAFLFGATRTGLGPIKNDLRELQNNACFYCLKSLSAAADVDHFLPWARHPDNGIYNLVAAHPRCNNRKRDFLAAAPHVQAWTRRFALPTVRSQLEEIAARTQWAAEPSRTLSVARAVYLRLPGDVPLWLREDEFERADATTLAAALTGVTSVAAEDAGVFEPEEPS